MSGKRAITLLGGSAVALGGYYLYQAGGDPKIAERQLEAHAAKVSSKIKGELPGNEREAKTQGRLYAEEAGRKIDSAVLQAKSNLQTFRTDAEAKLEVAKKETGDKLMGAVDQFDRSVEKGAAQTKGWLSGWFGGSK